MLDTFDANRQTQRLQHGLQPSFFPIVLDMTQLTVGTEVEANINPCDSLWIPTYFDSSLGLNPAQVVNGNNSPLPSVISTGPNFNRSAGQSHGGGPVGMNIFDVMQNGGVFFQAATIFSLRFNTVSAPWLLWGLSNLLSADFEQNFPGGQGDCMRSITGPIARMWYKKVAPALIGGQPTPSADRIVLLSSLGYSQVTAGVVCGMTDNTGTVTTPPSQSAYALPSGAYQITTLNSLEQEQLNLPAPGQLR